MDINQIVILIAGLSILLKVILILKKIIAKEEVKKYEYVLLVIGICLVIIAIVSLIFYK